MSVLAILVGGGPAPGINAVISAAVIEAINEGFEVLGVEQGFKHLMRARPVARPAAPHRRRFAHSPGRRLSAWDRARQPDQIR